MMRTSNSIITAVQSGSAAVRLREARRFLEQFEPGAEVLLLGASRGSVDDLARTISLERGATFGLHRLSFTQLAARLAVMELAARERAPATTLGHEAVATRAAFEARRDDTLQYFSPVSQTPGFPKALARTLLDLRLTAVASGDLVRLPRSGSDLAALLDRVDILLNEAGASDRASLFETATKALGSPETGWPPMPLLLLDVPFESEIEAQFLWALVQQSPHVMITVPAADASAVSQLETRGVRVQIVDDAGRNDLTQLARYLFSKEPPPERTRTGELVWFSAPGEGRECVEIARRILKEANRGVRFDEMAIVIRSTQQYTGVLEHALTRSGVPAYFERGTRRPDPTGRLSRDPELCNREFLRQTLCRISFARPGAFAGRCWQGSGGIRQFNLGGLTRRHLRRTLRARTRGNRRS
ncbi:MAG TPA: hypothetical protein VGW77_11155 [Candidatus Binatia bacterium]|jgi:hypothetical protein|nr:hypothetical protein [Candidatus Binatia bacterium]